MCACQKIKARKTHRNCQNWARGQVNDQNVRVFLEEGSAVLAVRHVVCTLAGALSAYATRFTEGTYGPEMNTEST